MKIRPCSLAKASPSSFFTSLLDSRSLWGQKKTLDIYSTIDLRYASTVLCFAPNDLLIHSVTFAS